MVKNISYTDSALLHDFCGLCIQWICRLFLSCSALALFSMLRCCWYVCVCVCVGIWIAIIKWTTILSNAFIETVMAEHNRFLSLSLCPRFIFFISCAFFFLMNIWRPRYTQSIFDYVQLHVHTCEKTFRWMMCGHLYLLANKRIICVGRSGIHEYMLDLSLSFLSVKTSIYEPHRRNNILRWKPIEAERKNIVTRVKPLK